MKTKVIILTIIMLLWASPAMANIEPIELDYHIGQCITPVNYNIESEPDPEKQGFWASRDPWTKKDTWCQLGVIITQLIDREMTLVTATNPTVYSEENPLLPEHPTSKQVNQYFTTIIVINPIISYMLPSKYRRIWQISNIGAELYCINNCYNAGIRIKF